MLSVQLRLAHARYRADLNELGAKVDSQQIEHNIMNEIRICTTNGGYSGPYQIAAASLVCNVRINMAFPPVNGVR